jgi:peptidyl-prolyl cis-trans isomerase SurA
MSTHLMKRTILALGLSAALCVPAMAQNLFKPVAQVNDSVITEFEVGQRVRFLQVLNAPGATRDAALNALIEDRLRILATQAAGLELGLKGSTPRWKNLRGGQI